MILQKQINLKNLDRIVNQRFQYLFNYYKNRTIIMYGGAGSGKSLASAQIIVLSLLQGRNQLVVRKVARTLKRSVFTQVIRAMNQLKLSDFFSVNQSDMTIFCMNGSVCYFVGCDDPQKLKSITPPKGMFNDIHIEESTQLSKQDFELIDTRQRGFDNKPRRIFLRFNPVHENHWIKTDLIDSGKYDIHLHKTTCQDNKFLSKVDKQKYKNYKNTSQYMYDVYYLGNWGVLGGVIFDFEVVDQKPKELTGIKPSYGLDFGWTNPSAVVRVFSDINTIYVDDQIYQKQLSIEDLGSYLLSFTNDQIIIADSQEPRSIDKLRSYGIQIKPAKKGKGSIISGIRNIQGRKLLINRRCINMIKQLQSYHFSKNKQGQTIQIPASTPDHLIDALRYSLESSQTHVEVLSGIY